METGIEELFKNWDETIIWSCLQGIIGEVHTHMSQGAAMAISGY